MNLDNTDQLVILILGVIILLGVHISLKSLTKECKYEDFEDEHIE